MPPSIANSSETDLKKKMSLKQKQKSTGHCSQIQQGSGINVLKSSSNFHHLIISTREVFPEIFSFIAQSSLPLWLFIVLEIVQKFLVCKFL